MAFLCFAHIKLFPTRGRHLFVPFAITRLVQNFHLLLLWRVSVSPSAGQNSTAIRPCCDRSGETFAVQTRAIASKLATSFEHDQA